ncbi:MAG: adenine-specific methyltransferase EcoRI family protein, partial [Burkholderiaceae bacterium]|nr:adenine-specific methyltransferase EcoRI family protein [Burkholderiaceae bacterium]
RCIDGITYLRSPSIWFTNLDHGRRHQPLQLMTMADNLKFSRHKQIKGKKKYDKYDNYDAIEVPFTDAIPSDFQGVMGVPISFLDKYNPDQFEILGATQRGCHEAVPDTKTYEEYWEVRQDGTRTGSSGGKTNENANLLGNDGKKNFFINSKGRVVQSAYQRIFIKHRGI